MVSLTPQERSLAVFIIASALGGALFLLGIRTFPAFARAASFIDSPRPILLVNINTADYYALVAVPGIGPMTAQRILRERQERGVFQDVSDLKRVKGLSSGCIDRLREQITATDR